MAVRTYVCDEGHYHDGNGRADGTRCPDKARGSRPPRRVEHAYQPGTTLFGGIPGACSCGWPGSSIGAQGRQEYEAHLLGRSA